MVAQAGTSHWEPFVVKSDGSLTIGMSATGMKPKFAPCLTRDDVINSAELSKSQATDVGLNKVRTSPTRNVSNLLNRTLDFPRQRGDGGASWNPLRSKRLESKKLPPTCASDLRRTVGLQASLEMIKRKICEETRGQLPYLESVSRFD